MGANPGTYTKTTWTNHPNWPDRSVIAHWVDWCNDQDWDSAVRITEIEFTDTGPLVGPEQSRVQTYRESDGGWDYLPETKPISEWVRLGSEGNEVASAWHWDSPSVECEVVGLPERPDRVVDAEPGRTPIGFVLFQYQGRHEALSHDS